MFTQADSEPLTVTFPNEPSLGATSGKGALDPSWIGGLACVLTPDPLLSRAHQFQETVCPVIKTQFLGGICKASSVVSVPVKELMAGGQRPWPERKEL